MFQNGIGFRFKMDRIVSCRSLTVLPGAFCPFCLLIIAGVLAVPGDALPKDVSVEFVITDCWGNGVRQASIELIPGKGKKIVIDYPTNIRAETIPGPYTVRVQSQGFLTWQHALVIEKRTSLVSACLTVAPIETGSAFVSSLTGNVPKPLIEGVRRWVRLVAVYSEFNATSSVNEYGGFQFERLTPGRYCLMYFIDGKLISSREIDIRAFRNTVAIDP